MTSLIIALFVLALVLLVEYARADSFSGRPRSSHSWTGSLNGRGPGHRER